jgi:hypothetical protein
MTRSLGLAAVLAAILAASPAACADEPTAAPGYKPPRTSDGRPDLQGVWTNASVTNLQRSAQYNDLIIPEAQAARVQAQQYAANQNAQRPTNQSAGAPTDRNTSAGYNRFWIDPGAALGNVKGTFRSSWIIDPPNGQMPISDKGRAVRAEIRRRTGAGNFDGPETRPMGERCLIGFGGTGGPPMLNVLYNNHYQIVQTPDAVMIMVEMNHDARVIPIAKDKASARLKPDAIKQWLGTSVGWYEGDTLVVETKNFHPTQVGKTSILVTETGKVTERFSRWSDDQILYEFEVEDPNVYTRPWKGEMSLNRDDQRIYEYACHEGNYALHGILAGARAEEREGREKKAVEGDEG